MKSIKIIILAATVFSLILVNTLFASIINYTYDDLNRLTKAEYEDGTMIDYSYDEVGNRTQRMVTISFIDTDNDGMPDSFENQYGLNPNDELDAGYDNDIGGPDGLTNLEAYLAGTDPTDADTHDDLLVDGSDSCPLILPVRIAGTSNYFSLLQTAYDIAGDGAVIQSQFVTLTEELGIDRTISVDLEGGYSCDYTSNTGTTSLNGSLSVNTGSLEISNGQFSIE